MEASRFSEAQIAFVLRQVEEGTAIGEVCRKAGISEATFYNWRKKYAGLLPPEMKQLEEENGKLVRAGFMMMSQTSEPLGRRVGSKGSGSKLLAAAEDAGFGTHPGAPMLTAQMPLYLEFFGLQG